MSLNTGILGSVVGSVFGRNPRSSTERSLGETLAELGGGAPIQSGILLRAALKVLQTNGGLDGVLARMRTNGLAAEADSWVGTGPNLPLSPSQLSLLLGPAGVDRAATPLNLSADDAGPAMAQILPDLVHQLTPDGVVPPNHADLIARSIAMLSHAGA